MRRNSQPLETSQGGERRMSSAGDGRALHAAVGRVKGGLGILSLGARERRLLGCRVLWVPPLLPGRVQVAVLVLHAIAVSVDDDGFSVMHQPIDQGGRERVVDVKDGTPLLEDAVGAAGIEERVISCAWFPHWKGLLRGVSVEGSRQGDVVRVEVGARVSKTHVASVCADHGVGIDWRRS